MTVTAVTWPGGDLRAAGSGWLWLHAPDARVAPDAVATLLDAERRLGDEPVLLAALVVDGSGRPRADRLPAGRESDTAATIAGVAQGALPIRNAPFAALLLRASAIVEHGAPDVPAHGAHAPVVWTARLLRERPGYLVPAAVVTEERASVPAGVGATVRAARSGTWTRGEQVRALAAAVRRRP